MRRVQCVDSAPRALIRPWSSGTPRLNERQACHERVKATSAGGALLVTGYSAIEAAIRGVNMCKDDAPAKACGAAAARPDRPWSGTSVPLDVAIAGMLHLKTDSLPHAHAASRESIARLRCRFRAGQREISPRGAPQRCSRGGPRSALAKRIHACSPSGVRGQRVAEVVDDSQKPQRRGLPAVKVDYELLPGSL